MDRTDGSCSGTDNNEAQEVLPWKFVPPDVRQELVIKLNPPAPLSGRDWRMLAYEMGCTAGQISFIESEKKNNTEILFTHYDVQPGASFNDVYKFLVKMHRRDCVDILDAAREKVRQAYLQAQRFHVTDISDPLVIGGHTLRTDHSCSCTNAAHLTPAYGSHPYCSCFNGYAVCGCVVNNQHHSDSTHCNHPLLQHPYQLDTSQPAGTRLHPAPSHTCSVNNNVTNKPLTHPGTSGDVHQEYSFVNPSNPGPQVYSLNENVFRNTRVFVTYSYDSELHARHVLSLCKFLRDNAFACFVDVREDDNSGRCSRLSESYRQRIAEVDFVLVCLSNKYLEDIAPGRPGRLANDRGHQLHTREIHELLNSKHLELLSSKHLELQNKKYLEQQNKNHHYSSYNSTDDTARSPCVVSLLFDEMPLNHIPRWMRSGPTYRWPQQYLDLAWLLTKPEERMRKSRDKNGRLVSR